jgi:phage N-6-adenine-methyltransferase
MHSAYNSNDIEADNSQTPWWIIHQLEDVANINIVHDVAARANSRKAATYWDKKSNALTKDWLVKYEQITKSALDVFYCNPPFSMMDVFVDKISTEAKNGVTTLLCCTHAPDRDWFQRCEREATIIYVPDGRIQFLTHDGKKFTRIDKHGKTVSSGANFPLCFFLFTPFNHGGECKQVRFNRDQKRYSV